MKKLLTLAIVLALAITVFAGTPFNRKISVTGASPQRLSTVLTTAGYAGATMQMAELEICNPITNAANIYLGQSDVSASNGYPLEPGTCKPQEATTQQDNIDAQQIFLFTASTQDVVISLRSK